MQRVFDVTYTPTADFVLSASDDGNVRIWKSNASQKLGPISTKERQAMEYRQKLVEQWSTEKHVRNIAERRHLPASVHSTTKLKREMLESRRVKEDRRRKHSRAGKEKPKAERKSEFIAFDGLGGNISRCEGQRSKLTPRRGHYQGTEVRNLNKDDSRYRTALHRTAPHLTSTISPRVVHCMPSTLVSHPSRRRDAYNLMPHWHASGEWDYRNRRIRRSTALWLKDATEALNHFYCR